MVLEDATAIAEQVPSVKRVAPQITSSQVVQAGARSATSSISGVTADFVPVRSYEIASGRFVNSQDEQAARAVVALGPDLRTKLFPTGDAIGQQVRIGSQAFEVIGVMAPKGAVFGSNQDENAYIPLSTMVNRLTGRDPTYGISLSFISVEAKNDKSTGAAKFQITNLLRQRHRILRDDDFAVRSQKDALTIVGTITGGLTLMLASIGGISLLVGGIGIMNSRRSWCRWFSGSCNPSPSEHWHRHGSDHSWPIGIDWFVFWCCSCTTGSSPRSNRCAEKPLGTPSGIH